MSHYHYKREALLMVPATKFCYMSPHEVDDQVSVKSIFVVVVIFGMVAWWIA
jgi:hypothetical protein